MAGPRGASSALPSTQTAASERAPERAEHHDHEGLTRPRHHRAALLGCAGPRWRRSLTDGRWSGGFTPEATAAARQANTADVDHPHNGGRGDAQRPAGAGARLCAQRRSEVAAFHRLGALRADSRWRRRAPHGARIRQTCSYGACDVPAPLGTRHSICAPRRCSSAASRPAAAGAAMRRGAGTGNSPERVPIQSGFCVAVGLCAVRASADGCGQRMKKLHRAFDEMLADWFAH